MVRKDFTSVTEKIFTGNHRKPPFEALVVTCAEAGVMTCYCTADSVSCPASDQSHERRSRGQQPRPAPDTRAGNKTVLYIDKWTGEMVGNINERRFPSCQLDSVMKDTEINVY